MTTAFQPLVGFSQTASPRWPLGYSLKDARRVSVRPIRPADETGLIEAFSRLQPGTVYRRFLSSRKRLSTVEAKRLTNVDYVRRLALVAESAAGASREIIAVARYEPTEDAAVAEIAVVAGDCWQGNGLGGILLDEIIRAARANHIHRFRADVLAENRKALRLLTSRLRIDERLTESGVTRLILSQRESTSGQPARQPSGTGLSGTARTGVMPSA